MEIITLSPYDFASNCYIIQSGTSAAVIDPSANAKRILGVLSERDLTLSAILLTHGHFDHMLHADELRQATGAPLYVHELDAELTEDGAKNAYSAFFGGDFQIKSADALLHDGDIISLSDENIKVIHTPGHTRGSVCFDTKDALLTGDTLFANGFGRCDLYGGDRHALSQSLIKLHDTYRSDRKIYCGHGEPSTLFEALDRLNFYF